VITVATRGQLPYVRVLARSYTDNHPDAPVTALLVDLLSTDDLPSEEFEVIGPWQLDLADDDFARMALMYDAGELVAALKPWALGWELGHGRGVALFLDATMLVSGTLDGVRDAARRTGIALTPHRLTPVPRDGLRPSEADIMAGGIFHLGCIAVTEAGRPWLEFWQERLRTEAVVDSSRQLSRDQRWADWIPSMFDHSIVTDAGVAVAWWNLDERGLEQTPTGLSCLGQPLVCVNLTGYDPRQPWRLCETMADAPRVIASEHPPLRSLLDAYGRELSAAGWTEEPEPYRYDTFADGATVTAGIRRLYRDSVLVARAPRGRTSAEPPLPDPLTGFSTIAAWLREASPRMPRLSRLAYAIWASRVDLQGTFPHPQTWSREAYLDWLATAGVREGYIDAAWVDELKPLAVEPAAITAEPGANLFGYFSSVLGVGTTGRAVVSAAERANVPINVITSTDTQSPRTSDIAAARSHRRYPVNIVAINADLFPLWLEQWGPAYASDAYTIGFWAWELEDLPARVLPVLAHVDEVWAISEFNAACFRKVTDRPVHVFPVPAVAGERQPWPSLDGLDRDRGYFVFVFDYLSEVERKNPVGLIAAYLQAFPDGDGPDLVIKSLNGEQRRTDRERVRLAARAGERIHLIEHYLPSDQLQALIQHARAFVSLHRSEGLGLGMMEAMAEGTPVIATGYSGNLEFMTAETAILIGYRMVPITASGGYYSGLGQWADPDLAEAAAAMQRLAADRTLAADLGARAQRAVLGTFTADRAAAFVRERIVAGSHREPPPRVSLPTRVARKVRRVFGRLRLS